MSGAGRQTEPRPAAALLPAHIQRKWANKIGIRDRLFWEEKAREMGFKINKSGAVTEPMKLSFHELRQLRSIGGPVYGDGRPYFWGAKTMPRLAAKGLVEPHKDQPNAWKITTLGKKVLSEQNHKSPELDAALNAILSPGFGE